MSFEVRPQVAKELPRKESTASSTNNVPTKPASIASSHGDIKSLGNGKNSLARYYQLLLIKLEV